MAERERSIDLYWIPLGAGAHVVRISGRLFEAISAAAGRRSRCDLYRSALVVSAGDGHFVIGQAPVPDLHGARRGVVAAGFGIDISSIQPPAGGRAPGWKAGRIVAQREGLPRGTPTHRCGGRAGSDELTG